MPQLNPSPWFFTSVVLWFIFLFIFSSKIKDIFPHQKPHSTLIFTPETPHWFWSWI
uniref:ATP synthase complex subunit 8 n=1 Tax=Oreolalax lichuanensis TaxID=265046 RepID=A0A342L0T5_ORELI|nr:ATP synthase F0 subunit 8 [Oreolalax lichuanensis]ANN35997.1 ATP synthase F0 subunit 8 [Oreolalax lichuanensis]